MSDFPRTDDELLSSFLDGEATAEERTRIEARLAVEPELRHRLASLRETASLVATPVAALGAAEREQLLRAAVAASGTAPNVTDLATARRRTDRWRTKIVGVAAASIALAIAVPAIRALDTPDSNSDSAAEATATASLEQPAPNDLAAPEESDGAEAEMADGATPDADGPDDSLRDGEVPNSTTAAEVDAFRALAGPTPGFDPLPEDLGAFADLTSVRAAARTAWTDAARAAAPDSEDQSPAVTDLVPTTYEGAANAFLDSYGGCGEAIGSVANFPFASSLRAVDYAEAHVGDELFTVGLFELSDGSGVVLVLDTDGCAITDDEALPAP